MTACAGRVLRDDGDDQHLPATVMQEAVWIGGRTAWANRIVVDGHEVSCGSSAFSTAPASESAAPDSSRGSKSQSPLAQVGATRSPRPTSFGRDRTELCLARPAGIGSGRAAGMRIVWAFVALHHPGPGRQSSAGPVRRRACKRGCFHADSSRLKSLAEGLVDRGPAEADDAGDRGNRLALALQLQDGGFLFFGQPHTAAGLAAAPDLALGTGGGLAG